MSNHRYQDAEMRESIESNDLATSSVTSEQSTSVIGALMKRFREAAPAPPGRRQAPVNMADMWWIDKNKKGVNTINRKENGEPTTVDDFIRESIESEDLGDADPLPRTGLGLGRTLQQRHDGGNLPKLHAAGGGGRGGGGGGAWQQYGENALGERFRVPLNPLNPFGQSASISQLSASQASGLGSLDTGASLDNLDLDAYANELLEKCDAIVDEFRTARVGAGAAGTGQGDGEGVVQLSLAEQVKWQSSEEGIRRAREQHLQQAGGGSSGASRENTTSDSPGPSSAEKELYAVEELDLVDGSPVADNIHVRRMLYSGNQAHDRPAIATDEDEIAATSVVIFPEKSPRSPPRTASGASAYRKIKSSSRTPNTGGTATTHVDTAASLVSNQRDSGSVFPLYLSSSGEQSQAELSHRSKGSTGRAGGGRNTSHSTRSSVSAFEMVQGEEGEVTVSFDASQIIRIPEMEGEEEEYEDQESSGRRQSQSPYLEVSQSMDGEVSVRASVDYRRSSASSLTRKAVAVEDVEAFLEDPVVSHLWGLLCRVRERLAAAAVAAAST